MKRRNDLWGTLGCSMFFLITIAALVFALAIFALAISFYRTRQVINSDDVKQLEELTTKLDTVLRDGGTLASAEAPIAAKNRELQDKIQNLRQANTQAVVVSNLDTISANLSYLSEIMKTERGKGVQVVGDLKNRVAELKKKTEPPSSWDNIVATVLVEAGKILGVVIWPLLVLSTLVYLIRGRGAPEKLQRLLRPFKSVKLFEAELVLSDEAKSMAEGTFENYRKQAIQNYDLFVQRKMLKEKFDNVVEEAVKLVKTTTSKDPAKYRCTLHVPDLVFADTLYQLLDYTPKGSGKGRIFSVRYGLIGRVWRSGKSEIRRFETTVVNGKQVVDEEHLIRQWGMSKREAQTAGEGRPSFLCAMLKTDQGDPVGMFYMDSENDETFEVTAPEYSELTDVAKEQRTNEFKAEKQKEILDGIVTFCRNKGIIELLAKMNDELGGRAPLIRIYEK